MDKSDVVPALELDALALALDDRPLDALAADDDGGSSLCAVAVAVPVVLVVAVVVLAVPVPFGVRLRCALASVAALVSAAVVSSAKIHRLVAGLVVVVVRCIVAGTIANVSGRAHHLRSFEHG